MRKIVILFFFLVVLTFFYRTDEVFAQALISDHTRIGEFDNGSLDPYLSSAISKRIIFKHASTGGYVNGNNGLNCLQGTSGNSQCLIYPDYKYDRRNWTWELWNPTEYSPKDKIDQFYENVILRNGSYDYFGMKLCYVDADSSFDYFSYYRDRMLDLERLYPNKKFIWATQVLQPASAYSGNCSALETINNFNRNVREYARSHSKPLYDMADIESYTPNGSRCFLNCNGQSLDVMCDQYSGDTTPPITNGHPGPEGSLRLAKGFWWIVVKMAQGGPIPTFTPTPRVSTTSTPQPTFTPTPSGFRGDADNDGDVDVADYTIWLEHFVNPSSSLGNPDFNNNGRVDGLDYVIWLNDYGT